MKKSENKIGLTLEEVLVQFDQRVTMHVLKSGLKILRVQMPGDRRFYLGAVIKTGSRAERPTELGISHFLEHATFRGSQYHPSFQALAEAFEKLGGEWNAATGTEHTEYWFSGAARHAAEGMTLFADFLANPLFQDIDTERQVILRELQSELNEFNHSTDLTYQISRLIWPQHPLSWPILGTPKTLAAMTKEALIDYRRRHYHSRNVVLCVMGGDELAATTTGKQALDHSFEHWLQSGVNSTDKDQSTATPHPPALPFVGPRAALIENSDNEYQLQVSFVCEGIWSVDSAVYELIVRILGDGFSSRLMRRIREELGLVYDIGADTSLYHDTGTINIMASVGTDQMVEFLRELSSELTRLTNTPVDENELERVKTRALIDLELQTSDPVALGFRLAWAYGFDQDTSLSKRAKRLAVISSEDILRVAKNIFCQKCCAIVALGPKEQKVESWLTSEFTNRLHRL